MRKAASGWEDDNSRQLTMDGVNRGRAAPTIFFRPETHVRRNRARVEEDGDNVRVVPCGRRDVQEIEKSWTELRDGQNKVWSTKREASRDRRF